MDDHGSKNALPDIGHSLCATGWQQNWEGEGSPTPTVLTGRGRRARRFKKNTWQSGLSARCAVTTGRTMRMMVEDVCSACRTHSTCTNSAQTTLAEAWQCFVADEGDVLITTKRTSADTSQCGGLRCPGSVGEST